MATLTAMDTLPPSSLLKFVSRATLPALIAVLAGCAAPQPPAPSSAAPSMFKKPEKANLAPLMSKEELALLDESFNPVYQIGSGDVVRVDVFGRPEVSGKHVVGPDGSVTLPIVGELELAGRSREESRSLVEKSLRRYYSHPHVTLAIEEYVSNQVTVLGRVDRPGSLKFPHQPTLAEVLASAGAMPVLDKQATLTRCAIMRGRERLIWIDLKAMLNGDPSYNMRMKKGDIVFIPDSADTAVYVLGQVSKPGSYRLTPRMTLLDAVAQAGGPNEDALPSQIGLYRAGTRQVELFSLDDLINPSRSINYLLEDGDVVYVPRSSLADFGYFMRQISPAMSVLNFGLALKAVSQ